MKRVLFLIVIASLSLTGCKFINEKILKKDSAKLEDKVASLEKELAGKEAEFEVTLGQLQRESQAMIDSIIMYYENELSGKGRKYTPGAAGTFYLIVGSFKTPSYAESYSAKIAGMGYRTQIVKEGYWNLVAAESYGNLREALKGLENVRSNVIYTAWIFVRR
jgi:hypothetical protein